MTYQKVIRHGNSLAVVIPAQICRELKIYRSDVVLMEVLRRTDMRHGEREFYLKIVPVDKLPYNDKPKKHV